MQKDSYMEQSEKNIKLVSNKNSRVILPNILTLVGVCIGLTSIKFAFDGKFELSIIAVVIAGVIDGLDGRICQLCNQLTCRDLHNLFGKVSTSLTYRVLVQRTGNIFEF